MAWVTNAYCSAGDVEIAVGGAVRLRQLADFNGTGNLADTAVQSVVTGWILDGAAEIRSAVEIKHDPETLASLDEPSLRRLNDANAVLSARIAHEKGAGGLEMPPQLQARAQRIEEFLAQLARGERRLGRVAGGRAAAINQPVGVVDHDPQGSGISVTAFRRSGFR